MFKALLSLTVAGVALAASVVPAAGSAVDYTYQQCLFDAKNYCLINYNGDPDSMPICLEDYANAHCQGLPGSPGNP